MAQIFDRRANTLVRLTLFVGVPLVLAILGGIWYLFGWSDWHRDVGVPVAQPGGGFNHQLHVGLKLDCRYCHNAVEVSSSANVPSTETCMGCHSQILTKSEKLAFVRESWETNTPIQWNRVHDLPKFVYFNHSLHVAKGVGCSTCHGRVDLMPLMWNTQSLQMEWCLSCHRNPEPVLREQKDITNMEWVAPPDQEVKGKELAKKYNLQPTEVLTSCSTCHR